MTSAQTQGYTSIEKYASGGNFSTIGQGVQEHQGYRPLGEAITASYNSLPDNEKQTVDSMPEDVKRGLLTFWGWAETQGKNSPHLGQFVENVIHKH